MFKYGLVDYRQADDNAVLVNAFTALQGQRTDGPDWDILWYFGPEPPVELYKNIAADRRISHIPGITAVADKWYLFNNLKRNWQNSAIRDGKGQSRRFFPETWLLTEDRDQLLHWLQSGKALILKPTASSMGRGIQLIHNVDELPENGDWLAQEYLDDPHLINQRKYILRLFLLITSTDPLTVYLYRDGIADLTVQAYSGEHSERHNLGIHIANGALQSTLPGFDINAHCMDLEQWREHVAKKGDAAKVWEDINAILKHTLHAVSTPLREASMRQMTHPEQCFDLLGVDIMLDSTLRPWLIECNRSPSLTAEYSDDLKPRLLKDTLGLILDRRQVLIDTGDGQADPAPVAEFGGYQRVV